MSLGSLPLEIKVMIMADLPDLASLQGITHASPSYHQAYCGARQRILHWIAISVLQASDMEILGVDTIGQGSGDYDSIAEDIREFCQAYQVEHLKKGPYLEIDRSVDLLQLHSKVVTLIDAYCKASSNFILPSGVISELVLPTNLESCRLHRAFWRWEMYSRLFGPSGEFEDGVRGPLSANNSYWLSSYGIASRFLRLLPSHEVEELACLYQYASKVYDTGSECIDNCLIASGPTIMYHFLKTPRGPCFNRLYGDLIKRRPATFKAPMSKVLDAYLGIQDHLSGWPWSGAEHPKAKERKSNAGWQWAIVDGVENFNIIPRRWGFVFWDEERLLRWGLTPEDMRTN